MLKPFLAAAIVALALVVLALLALPPREQRSGVSVTAPGPTAEAPVGTTLPDWEKFSVSVPASGQPTIAIVIDDLGIDTVRSQRAIDLPGPLTLSFLAYAEKLPERMARGNRAGHELMLHIPMEPMSADENPGPEALLLTLGTAENTRRLREALGRSTGYVGVNNHMGSRFTAEPAAMAPVLEEIKARGLLYLDSRTGVSRVSREIATRLELPFAERDIFLDDDRTPEAVARQLQRLEIVARREGSAIAIGHPADVTLDALAQWLPTLQSRGFQLVPVSAIVRQRLRARGLAAAH